MNQCPPGSQGTREQLGTGLSGPLDFAATEQKAIFQPKFSYGVFLVHPAMGRLMRWDLGGRGTGLDRLGDGCGRVLGMCWGNVGRVVGGQGWKVNIKGKLPMGGD